MNKERIHKIFYTTTALLGLLLCTLEVNIYQRTVIPMINIFAVVFPVSVATFFCIKKDYRNTYQRKSLFFPIMQSILSSGFIACYIFMASNFYFAHEEVDLKSCLITYKHTIGTKDPQPAIEIDYEGVEKQLVFYTGQQDEVNKSRYVLLTVRKGFWGYDVFYDIKLK
jgi:hypothetical protein